MYTIKCTHRGKWFRGWNEFGGVDWTDHKGQAQGYSLAAGAHYATDLLRHALSTLEPKIERGRK